MKYLFTIFLLLISITGFSQDTKLEKYYQTLFAETINGKMEVVLEDLARVDIVTDSFAIEVDFAKKWAESIGQSLYYALELNKKAGVLLIVNGEKDNRYIQRLLTIARKYNITIWLIDIHGDVVKRVNK